MVEPSVTNIVSIAPGTCGGARGVQLLQQSKCRAYAGHMQGKPGASTLRVEKREREREIDGWRHGALDQEDWFRR